MANQDSKADRFHQDLVIQSAISEADSAVSHAELPPEVSIVQEKLIISVANTAIRNCPCYMHLCSRCKEAKTLLGMCGVRHYFVACEDRDRCEDCGRDLRDLIHLRPGERP